LGIVCYYDLDPTYIRLVDTYTHNEIQKRKKIEISCKNDREKTADNIM